MQRYGASSINIIAKEDEFQDLNQSTETKTSDNTSNCVPSAVIWFENEKYNKTPKKRIDGLYDFEADRKRREMCKSKTPSVPIPSNQKIQDESLERDRQMAMNTRRYDSSTWMMYQRIVEGRSRRPRPAVAVFPGRIKQLIARQSNSDLPNFVPSKEEERCSDDGSLSTVSSPSEEVFVFEYDCEATSHL